MAQTTQITIDNQTFPSFRSKLNESLSALNTLNSGTSRPSSAVAGTIWLDTTSATNPTLKFYDGADDISLATIDYSANTVNWLDSSVTLTSPVSISGSASAGAEIRLPEDTDNGSHYVGLKAPDSIASDVTFTLPSADGTADQVLKTDGSGNLSFTDVSGGTSWQSSIVTGTTLSAVAGNGYWIDTTSNACTITLPASASVGDTIEFSDYARKWGTNAVTLNTNSLNFQGNTSPNPIYNTNGQSVKIVYSGATQGWIPTVDDDVTLETPQPISADFLVIAGGGSGQANSNGGGGGAGGYRTSTQNLTIGATYTITVGDGGASVTGGVDGNNGSDSSISGTGITTITSAGGGRGGNTSQDGGSGGGGGTGQAGGSGNTPSTSPSQGNDGGDGSSSPDAYGAGGGGGAGAVGQDGTGSKGGNGGDGLASSITGSSVTRAGGGGGGTNTTIGTGGAGGGGDSSASGNAVAGTANTGSGGGGCDTPVNSGAGGKGVVILSVPTANYSGITTGSPTITTSGSNTIMQFNGSGSYTA